MKRFIPSQIEEDTKVVKNLSFLDLAVLIVGLVLIFLVLASSLTLGVKIFIIIPIAVIFVLSVMTFDMVKGYKLLVYWVKYIFRRKRFRKINVVKSMGLKFNENHIVSDGKRIAVIELNGVDFSILEEKTQDDYIFTLGEVIKDIKNGKIVKLEKPFDLTKYIDWNNDLISRHIEKHIPSLQDLDLQMLENSGLSSTQPSAPTDVRVEMLENQNEYLKRFQYFDRIFIEGYYLVIIEDNEIALNLVTDQAVARLTEIGLAPQRLKSDELKVFLSLYLKNDISDFFESDILKKKKKKGVVAVPENTEPHLRELDPEQDILRVKERSNKIVINNKEMRVICLGRYPYFVANAWGFEIFTIPGTKVVFNFSEYPNKNINRRISRTMTELNSRLSDQKLREDEKKKLYTSWQSLDALLESLEFDSEKLLATECYMIYPKARHREILKILKGKGIKINDLLFTQFEGWVASNPLVPMPAKTNKERVSPIQSSSVAGLFPFVSKVLNDDRGFYLGGSTRYPIFFNQFLKTNTRVNHNMVVFGKSGGGKSYFMKKLAMRSAMEDKKVFILDPDNEYDYLCDVVKGNWIDVAGEKSGRMNPLHIFASMKDAANGNVGDLSSHKLFLDEFFRTVLPDMDESCRLYLNECVTRLYAQFKIFDSTDVSNYKPEQFPRFSDLYKLIGDMKRGAEMGSPQEAIYELLELNIKQFTGEGLYARLWNGYTTLNINNDFNVLNFQALFANSNTHIANGQMLLLMRFLNQEVIKNRDLNLKGANKKIEVWIDEAHRFIDPNFPVALKFMSTMAKQIRKYDGALIVATQNIADFVGVSDTMKAMATAVINSCQYSMIFGLLANDINSIRELYANYNGGLTAQEVDFIGHARQGDALLIVDTNTRIPLHVELYANEEKYILPQTMRA